MSPAHTEAKALQGATSKLSELTLHDGRKLAVKLGGAVLPGASLTRTIEGASSITIPLYDPERKFLRDVLLRAKWDATIDGLPFRYLGTSKSGKQLTIRLIDRRVAQMKEHFGPKKVLREPHGKDGKVTTRAEFIKSLFEEACPGLEFYCPELHVKQPIKTAAQGKAAKSEAEANRGKGVGASTGLKVKGQAADTEQTDIIDRALRVAEHDKAPFAARVALVAALIDESECRNTHGGTGSSVGVLQLTDIHGSVSVRLNVEHCVHLFLTEGFTDGVGAIKHANAGMAPADIATAVQGNAAGASVYAPYVAEARANVEVAEGGSISEGNIEVELPYRFEVKEDNGKGKGEPEDYWEAAERLAGEVNWRLFLLPTKAVFIDEIELIKGQVRLEIDNDTTGVEDVDFDFNLNKPILEATVTAFASEWSPPPGTVVTLADYGPASLGAGDAPGSVKVDSKGRKSGIASAVNAATNEGKGRYLVSLITTPLTEDSEARKASIKLKRPTPPLPEPAAAMKSVEGLGGLEGSAAGSAPVQQMHQAAETEAAKKRGYSWGGGHDALFTGPYDCSGFVSYLLHVGGFLNAPLDTVGLASWDEAGEGNEITVYVKTSGDSEEEHTAIKIGEDVFESGGGSENTNPNGGAGKVSPSQVTSFLAQFDVKRHPKGF